MTREKLQFLLPVVFTVGPDVNQRGESASQAPRDAHSAENAPEDRGDALMRFAMLLADGEEKKDATRRQHIENIVKGIIEGETRVLVSSMSMEEIFTEREYIFIFILETMNISSMVIEYFSAMSISSAVEIAYI